MNSKREFSWKYFLINAGIAVLFVVTVVSVWSAFQDQKDDELREHTLAIAIGLVEVREAKIAVDQPGDTGNRIDEFFRRGTGSWAVQLQRRRSVSGRMFDRRQYQTDRTEGRRPAGRIADRRIRLRDHRHLRPAVSLS